MTSRAATPPAHQLLRLLLGDPRVDPDDLDWSLILPLARDNRLLLRLMDWFTARGELAPEPFTRAARAARQRNAMLLEFIARTGERCGRMGVSHVWLKAAHEYPDLGRDVDLLVPASADATSVLFDHAPAPPRRFRPRARLAGTSTRRIPGTDVLLDIRHGRLGRLGEHTRFPADVLERSRAVTLGDIVCFAPSPEDTVLLQALSRLYGRPALGLNDVLAGVLALRPGLDWDALLERAREAGLSRGLSLYLELLDQLHQELLDRPLLPAAVRQRLDEGLSATARFRGNRYSLSAARVTGPLYLRQFLADVSHGDWRGAGRLFLLPLLACAAGYNHVAHQRSGGT